MQNQYLSYSTQQVAAKRDKEVKEAILDYFKNGKDPVRKWSRGKDDGKVTFNLGYSKT